MTETLLPIVTELPVIWQATSLYLHTISGVVYASSQPGQVAELRLPDWSHVSSLYRPQVLGSRSNAALLSQLGRTTLDTYVATPLLLDGLGVTTPQQIFSRMRDFQRLPSQGGFHKLAPGDLVSYQLRLLMNGQDADLALHLQRHPAWPAISFLVMVDRVAAAKLVAEIADPRWFVEPTQPDHQRKIFSYLGLVPSAKSGYTNMEAILSGSKSRGVNFERAQQVVQAWTGGQAGWQWVAEPNAPGAYLFRYWENGGHGAKGLLHASRRFVRFLCLSWLDTLHYDTRRNLAPRYVSESPFNPSYFFEEFGEEERSTTQAWIKHREACLVAR